MYSCPSASGISFSSKIALKRNGCLATCSDANARAFRSTPKPWMRRDVPCSGQYGGLRVKTVIPTLQWRWREDALPGPEAEQRLRHAERLEAVGRLAGGVAHDFNNLLTGVLLYCDLLLAHIEPCHRVRKYAEEIRSAGVQAAGVVRQLLSVARPTTCEPCLCSLNEIAEGMRNLLARLIGENIELKYCLDPNLGLVRLDATQSQQILLNLVLNARDALPGGGQITIETSNCKVQVLTEPRAESAGAASLPCFHVLFSQWPTTDTA